MAATEAVRLAISVACEYLVYRKMSGKNELKKKYLMFIGPCIILKVE